MSGRHASIVLSSSSSIFHVLAFTGTDLRLAYRLVVDERERLTNCGNTVNWPLLASCGTCWQRVLPAPHQACIAARAAQLLDCAAAELLELER